MAKEIRNRLFVFSKTLMRARSVQLILRLFSNKTIWRCAIFSGSQYLRLEWNAMLLNQQFLPPYFFWGENYFVVLFMGVRVSANGFSRECPNGPLKVIGALLTSYSISKVRVRFYFYFYFFAFDLRWFLVLCFFKLFECYLSNKLFSNKFQTKRY